MLAHARIIFAKSLAHPRVSLKLTQYARSPSRKNAWACNTIPHSRTHTHTYRQRAELIWFRFIYARAYGTRNLRVSSSASRARARGRPVAQ